MGAGSDDSSGAKTKVIYGIRHARSISNDWMELEGNRWGDASFRDDPSHSNSPISEKGRQQVDQLREQLLKSSTSTLPKEEGTDVNSDSVRGDWLSDVELVVVSPLTRCLQTWELGCRPALERCQTQQLATGMKDGKSVQVIAHALATERVFTVAETGRPVAELQKDFDQVDWSLMLEEYGPHGTWWYTGGDDHPEWRPSDNGQYYAVPGEPEVVFEERLSKLRAWLQQRPERTILLVVHWGVLLHLTGKDMRNCEVCRVEWPGDE